MATYRSSKRCKEALTYKDMTNEEFVKLMNKEFPINISNFTQMIDDIDRQYGKLNKYQIARFVKAFFTVMRNNLFLGNSLNADNYLTRFQIKLKKRISFTARFSSKLSAAKPIDAPDKGSDKDQDEDFDDK